MQGPHTLWTVLEPAGSDRVVLHLAVADFSIHQAPVRNIVPAHATEVAAPAADRRRGEGHLRDRPYALGLDRPAFASVRPVQFQARFWLSGSRRSDRTHCRSCKLLVYGGIARVLSGGFNWTVHYSGTVWGLKLLLSSHAWYLRIPLIVIFDVLASSGACPTGDGSIIRSLHDAERRLVHRHMPVRRREVSRRGLAPARPQDRHPRISG